MRIAVTVFFLASVSQAQAETRGALRVGVLALDLAASEDTPLFGDNVQRAVKNYNAAASNLGRPRIDSGDLGVDETLLVLSPGLELASGAYFFRIEAPIGFAGDLTSIGVGVYPLNLQLRLRADLAAYVSAGGSASWLDRPGSGDVGGLVLARAAIGVRFARHFVGELGYSAFALGGSVNNERIEAMTTNRMLEEPGALVSAGEARGLLDVSAGFTF